MRNTENDELIDINALAKMTGVSYPVRLSPELAEILKPNTFLSEQGIQYTDRINTVLSLLKGNLMPDGKSETIPANGISIPMTIVKGPYIREEIISIKAEFTDDGGKKEILLTAILESE